MKCCQVPSTSCDLCTCKELLCPTVQEEINLQENTFFDLDLVVTQNIAKYLFIMIVIYASTKFEDATSYGFREDNDKKPDRRSDFGTQSIYPIF